MSNDMQRSRSVPGLSSLGTSGPRDMALASNYKKGTLAYHLSSPVDWQQNKGISNKAFEIAHHLKKPAWRIAGTEPRAPPPESTVPKNMRWPRLSPAWLKHNQQCLRWYAYFQEAVVERWDENCRYRHVVITYSMEDGTIGMSEPKVENSGITQGKFLRRHQVPKADGPGVLGPMDFRIGEEIEIYGRVYHITGCDRFTRWFFEENGVELPDDEAMVKDMWQKSYTFTKIAEKGGLPISRSAQECKHLTMFQLGQPPQGRKFVQFLLNDRKVLRFKAYWDDLTLYGNRIYFVVHFYLADNTVEINEAHARNSGRDNYPVFYKRGPLLKENRLNAYPGMLEPDPVHYEPKDLIVGQSIHVWGREVVIYDCDDFTQKFYSEYLGHDQKAGCIDVSEKPLKHSKLYPPPHNGVGYEEDSLQNCLMIQPKAAKQDLVRLMTLSGEILRFEAILVNGEPEDENRKFIVGWFPADYMIACWELPGRNSGHMGGKFAEKKRLKNVDTGKYFELHELFVGATIMIKTHPLYLTRADEHTLRFLEGVPDEYPMADPLAVAAKLGPLRNAPELQGPLDPDFLKEIASERGIPLVDHEIITLIRNFAGDSGPTIDGGALLEAIDGCGRGGA